MSRRLVKAAHDQSSQLGLSLAERAVLISMAYAVRDEADNTCYPSNGWLADQNGLTVRGVIKIRQRLQAKRLVEMVEAGGGRRSNRYRLTLPAAQEPARAPATHERRSPVNAVHPSGEPGSYDLFRKKDSVPDGTAATAAPPERSLKSKLFGECLDWLVAESERGRNGCRSYIAKLIAQHGEGAVLQAFADAEREDPVDPLAYIRRILDGSRNPGKSLKSNGVADPAGARRAFGELAVQDGLLPADALDDG